MTQSFKEVFAWQKAHELVVMVYKATKQYPSFERFGLCSQFKEPQCQYLPTLPKVIDVTEWQTNCAL